MSKEIAQDPESPAEEEPKAAPKKKVALLAGAALIVPSIALALALMAIPEESATPRFDGPYVGKLTPDQVQVNLGDQKERYFVFEHNIVFEAYSEGYYQARQENPLYLAYLKDALIGLATSKTPEQVYEVAYEPSFREEIRSTVEPLLFPVHVGLGQNPTDADPLSGLAPGRSAFRATFRHPFHEHVLQLDDELRTVRLEDGPSTSYTGQERDLAVYSADQEVVYLDMTGVERGFRGDVQVGVMGRVIGILKVDALLQ